MEFEKDLRITEKRAYLLYYKDGLLDITIGLCILFTGLVFTSNFAYLWILFATLDVLAWRIAKKYITYPRIGQATYSQERTRKTSILLGLVFFSLISFIAMGIMLLVLYGGSENTDTTNILLLNEVQLVTGIFTVLLLGFSVAILGLHRFIVYSGLALVALLVNQLQDIILWNTYIYLGVIITIIGILILCKFLARFKIINTATIEEEINDK